MTETVLQVITDSDRRGAQVFAVDLGQFLSGKGFDVTTVALRSGDSATKLDVEALSGSGRGLAFLRPLQERMRRADVVIAHGSRTLMASAFASFRVSTPIVYRQISDLNFWARRPIRSARVRAYLRRMSHAVALWADSAYVLNTKFGVPREMISIIPNGVNPDLFRPPIDTDREVARQRFGLPPDADVILCVNALVPEKGVALAIGALRHVPQARLLVVGDGPQRGELQHLAGDMCPGRVIFAGAVDDVTMAYHAADAFLLPSYTEVMPAVVVEAILCGLPVVATRVGAVPTMLGEVGGFFVDHDSIDIARGITEALESLGCDTGARDHYLANFTLDLVGEAWVAVLRSQTGAALARIG